MESYGAVIFGLEGLLAAGFHSAPLGIDRTSLITVKRLEKQGKHVLNSNRKPWRFFSW